MVVDLKRVFVTPNASLPLTYSFDMSSVPFAGAFPLSQPVAFRGTVSNRADLVQLAATISFVFVAPCDRCGDLVKREHTVKVEKVLAVSAQSEESESILLTPDMKLDLDELIYSEVVVNIPTKHLCRDDCAGLCPVCGKNLNSGNCGCVGKEIDPRLSALAELLN